LADRLARNRSLDEEAASRPSAYRPIGLKVQHSVELKTKGKKLLKKS